MPCRGDRTVCFVAADDGPSSMGALLGHLIFYNYKVYAIKVATIISPKSIELRLYTLHVRLTHNMCTKYVYFFRKVITSYPILFYDFCSGAA